VFTGCFQSEDAASAATPYGLRITLLRTNQSPFFHSLQGSEDLSERDVSIERLGQSTSNLCGEGFSTQAQDRKKDTVFEVLKHANTTSAFSFRGRNVFRV